MIIRAMWGAVFLSPLSQSNLFETRSRQRQRELLNERESSGAFPANRVGDLGKKYELVTGFN